MQVRWATKRDLEKVKRLAQAHRHELGFVREVVLKEAIANRCLFVAVNNLSSPFNSRPSSELIGFVHFRFCRDGHATIYEIAVASNWRKRGVGKELVKAVTIEAKKRGCHTLRLKCPVNLPANGFYSRLGFVRIGIEDGKERPLAVWELDLRKETFEEQSKAPTFFVTLTHEATEIRKILRLWDESGDKRNPFAHLVFTPLFSKPATVATIRQLKDQRGSTVMFDSGGYQVQTGKATYEELFDRLLRFYRENDWADFYVLPDHVPCSSDSDREVDFKVRETIDFARLFLRMMPSNFAAKAIGVVHGRTGDHVRFCVKAYADMGIRYIGFGSFGTSGPNGTVNMLSQKSLRLLKLVQTLACEYGLRLHIFGIGSPSHLIRLQQSAIVPDSFDSAGWWKAGGFGKVFFPGGRQLHITRLDGHNVTQRGIEREKQRTNHDCPFCADVSQLRRQRIMRVMHNLMAMLETVGRIGKP